MSGSPTTDKFVRLSTVMLDLGCKIRISRNRLLQYSTVDITLAQARIFRTSTPRLQYGAIGAGKTRIVVSGLIFEASSRKQMSTSNPLED